MKRFLVAGMIVLLMMSCKPKMNQPIKPENPVVYEFGNPKLMKSVCFTPDGKFLLAGGQNKKIVMVERDGGKVVWESPERPDAVLALAVSPDGKLLAQTCGDNTQNTAELIVWDILTKKEIWGKKNLTNDVQFVRFSPDGKTLAVAHYFNIILYEAATGNQIKFFSGHSMDVAAPYGHVDAVTDIEFTVDPLKFISVGWDKNVKIWDTEIGHEMKTYPEGDPINTCILIDDGKRIITGSNGGLHVWNRETNVADTVIDVDADIQMMEKVRNGQYFVTGDEKGTLLIWRTAGFQKINEMKNAHQRGVWSLSASPDGNYIASAGGDGKVILWQIEYLLQYKEQKDSTKTETIK
jgi:WD40 repeat protein